MYTSDGSDTTVKSHSLARWWLLLAVAALIGSGIPALELVIARTTGLATGDLFMQLFHKALVVHVDLSVLVWFLTIAGMVWSMEAAKCRSYFVFPYLEQAALISMGLGAALLTLSPLVPAGEPLMSNYIPVISNPMFFLGLALILTALLLQAVHVLLKRPRFTSLQGVEFAVSLGGYTAAWAALISLAAIAWALRVMPDVIEGQQYYDLLFWAGGHSLQFLHGSMLMIAWLWLAALLWPQSVPGRGWLAFGFAMSFAGAAVTPLGFALFEVTSSEFRQFYTEVMRGLGGIGPLVAGVLVFRAYWVSRGSATDAGNGAIKAALLMSFLVFAYGGLLGFLIRGQNVIIPAHYHGSIVGITLAFMGLAVALFPRFGWREMAATRLARMQPVVLGIGQILHVTGLAILGGHGTPRKTPGMPETVYLMQEIAVQAMRLGGLLAVLGGVLFVVLVVRAVRRKG